MLLILKIPKILPARTAWPATKDLQDEVSTESTKESAFGTCRVYNVNKYPAEHPDATSNVANIPDRQVNGLHAEMINSAKHQSLLLGSDGLHPGYMFVF